MTISNLDVNLGQMFRKRTHVRRFNEALANPREVQMRKLKQILRRNNTSRFGQDHDFDRIFSYEDYRSRVPASTYEYFQPYIERLAKGESNQLTCEQPFMFATTSGTTDRPKYIPITDSHLRDYTHAFQVHNYQLIESFEKAASGKFLIITSNDEEGRTESGIPYGAVSGLLNRRQPSIIRKHFAVPFELCKLKDVDTKYYMMLRVALVQNVTAILGCNPSSILLIAEHLRNHGEDLIKDVRDGGVNSLYAQRNPYLSAFAPYLEPDPKRAAELESLLSRNTRLLPKDIWPGLDVISCWKGGPMSFYLDQMPEYYGNVPIRDFGYMASEGRGSIPVSDTGAGGILATTSHFFEFVSEFDIDNDRPRFLTADQLKLGGRYYIFFTTNAGLFRYNINDLVEVTDFAVNTPVIAFVRKGVGVSSITGEKVTENQILASVNETVKTMSLSQVNHFSVEVELGYPPYYVCYIETDDYTNLCAQMNETQSPPYVIPNSNIEDTNGNGNGNKTPDSNQTGFINAFASIFDRALRSQNLEYDSKRNSRRLGHPRIRFLPRGTYLKLRQLRVIEGAPEAQVKIPLLNSPNAFSKRLALLEMMQNA